MTNILHGTWNGVCSTARFAKNTVDTAASATNCAIDRVAGEKVLNAAKIAGVITAVALGAIALTALVIIGTVYLGPAALALGGKAVALLSPLVATAWATCAPFLAVAATATGSAIATAASATSAFVTSVSVTTALKVTVAVAGSAALIGYVSTRNVDKSKLYVGEIKHTYNNWIYNRNVKKLDKSLAELNVLNKEEKQLPSSKETEEDQSRHEAFDAKKAEFTAKYQKVCEKVGSSERALNLNEARLNELNAKIGRTQPYSSRNILGSVGTDDKLIYPVLQ